MVVHYIWCYIPSSTLNYYWCWCSGVIHYNRSQKQQKTITQMYHPTLLSFDARLIIHPSLGCCVINNTVPYLSFLITFTIHFSHNHDVNREWPVQQAKLQQMCIRISGMRTSSPLPQPVSEEGIFNHCIYKFILSHLSNIINARILLSHNFCHPPKQRKKVSHPIGRVRINFLGHKKSRYLEFRDEFSVEILTKS